MAHAFARGRGGAGNECHHWFGHVRLNPLGTGFLVVASYFSAHDASLGLWIFIEHRHHIHMLQPINWVTANPDTGRLAEAHLRQLTNHFIGQRARSRNHTDRPRTMYVTRHDADLNLLRCD